jgi:L-malate glycosyltransferase
MGMPAAPPIPIAFFLTSFGAGGTERQMLELVRRLDRGRFEAHLACFHRDGAWVSRAEAAADSLSEFPISSFRSPATIGQGAAFAAWCRRRHIALVQACDLYANIFALPAAAAGGVRHRIASRRELNPDKSALQIGLQRLAYSFAHRVVANSEAAAARLRREGVTARKILVIPNGIDLARFEPPLRDREIRRLVTVAAFRPEKAHDVLIAAAAEALTAVPSLSLTLVGDGPTRPSVEGLVRRLGLGGRIRFLGHANDVAAVLRDHDAFVLPSRSEAFPNAVIEAMAMAMPVVATEAGGIPELVAHGRTGILVSPDRPDALARAIVDLVRRPGFAQAMGRRARADVVARFSLDRMVARFESLYLWRLTGTGAESFGHSHSQPAVS